VSPPVDVHVAIINWNTAASALQAAAGYRDSTGVTTRVTIVDNASAEPQRELLRAGVGDGVELLQMGRNLGYGSAANVAFAHTKAGSVCVSNSDLLPAPDMLAQLLEVARAVPAAGLVAPRFDGGKRGYHAKLPRPAVLPLWAFSGAIGHVTVPDPPAGVVIDVEQPAGACLLVATDVWRALGGFDEGFFLWLEDVDLARRSLAAGYRNLVVGSAVARHIGGVSFAALDARVKHRIWNRSLDRYTTKHHHRLRLLTRLAMLIAIPAMAVAHPLRELARSALARHRAMAA
jgi:GT2 family glycosyltransferase